MPEHWHSGRVVTGFLDGHVEPVELDDINHPRKAERWHIWFPDGKEN
jgi:prepilin-type processing-associated H-X9-DG protein